ncbi:MAG: hypothetical protein NXI32_04090 [bacterium]|nr:hypothetical protein [bacterium]
MAALTEYQRNRRDELVVRVKNNIADTGEALLEIHRDELYLEHGDFERFIKIEFGYSKGHAYKLMRCRKTQRRVSHGTLIPKTQKVLEVLTAVPEEKQQEVWEAAVAEASKDGELEIHPTEKIVRKVAKPYLPEPKPRKPKPKHPAELIDKDGLVIAETEAEEVNDCSLKRASVNASTPVSSTIEPEQEPNDVPSRSQQKRIASMRGEDPEKNQEISRPKPLESLPLTAGEIESIVARLDPESAKLLMDRVQERFPELAPKADEPKSTCVACDTKDEGDGFQLSVEGESGYTARKIKQRAEDFYQAYPRKIKPKVAKDAFVKAVARKRKENSKTPTGEAWDDFIVGSFLPSCKQYQTGQSVLLS